MTAQQLIEGAMRLIDQLKPGYSASATDLATSLDALNQMLAAWSAEGLMLYAIAEDSVAVTPGTTYYTWGTGGNINTARPVKIRSAYHKVGQISVPVRLISVEEWDQIVDRDSVTALTVDVIYADGGYPLLKVYPWPKAQGGTLFFHSLKPLTAFADLSTVVDLPPGYEHALRLNLALLLAPEFRRTVEPSLPAHAMAAKATLAQINAQMLGMPLPPQAATEGVRE
jgi:hypothetical protein